jgi:predicted negative regulator of RcsB-dependent stress response
MTSFLIFLNKYYKHLLFILVIIFALLASFIYFDNLNKNQIKKDGFTYINSLLSNLGNEGQNNKNFQNDLKLIENNKNYFGIFSKILLTQDFLKESDYIQAKNKLEEIFQNKKNEKIINDYAIFLYSKILISEKKFDDFLSFVKQRNILDQTNQYTFFQNIAEYIIISYIKQNQFEEAINLIEKIKKDDTIKDQKTIGERINQLEIFAKYTQK